MVYGYWVSFGWASFIAADIAPTAFCDASTLNYLGFANNSELLYMNYHKPCAVPMYFKLM